MAPTLIGVSPRRYRPPMWVDAAVVDVTVLVVVVVVERLDRRRTSRRAPRRSPAPMRPAKPSFPRCSPMATLFSDLLCLNHYRTTVHTRRPGRRRAKHEPPPNVGPVSMTRMLVMSTVADMAHLPGARYRRARSDSDGLGRSRPESKPGGATHGRPECRPWPAHRTAPQVEVTSLHGHRCVTGRSTSSATSGSQPQEATMARTRSSSDPAPAGTAATRSLAVEFAQDATVGDHAGHPLPGRGDVGHRRPGVAPAGPG